MWFLDFQTNNVPNITCSFNKPIKMNSVHQKTQIKSVKWTKFQSDNAGILSFMRKKTSIRSRIKKTKQSTSENLVKPSDQSRYLNDISRRPNETLISSFCDVNDESTPVHVVPQQKNTILLLYIIIEHNRDASCYCTHVV